MEVQGLEGLVLIRGDGETIVPLIHVSTSWILARDVGVYRTLIK